ncbi:hypothetical protein SCLCIDRAFT_849603 [Scleroderma citrinum Foug A]|uniref:Uncharacterized protein n=1 Tax=Scleroderma citrinum Foug A TaxID=1036808 RepID=A0A0C3E287_9AGAM|nr:hypothetical protein SCLCIDRAFT_849603 [Scleroderma citrinum Foug A]
MPIRTHEEEMRTQNGLVHEHRSQARSIVSNLPDQNTDWTRRCPVLGSSKIIRHIEISAVGPLYGHPHQLRSNPRQPHYIFSFAESIPPSNGSMTTLMAQRGIIARRWLGEQKPVP